MWRKRRERGIFCLRGAYLGKKAYRRERQAGKQAGVRRGEGGGGRRYGSGHGGRSVYVCPPYQIRMQHRHGTPVDNSV